MIGLVLASLVAQANSAAPFPASGTYAYAATVSGKPAGQASLNVSGSPGAGLSIVENSSGDFSGTPSTAKATMSLANDLSVTAYTAAYVVGSRNLQSNVVFKGATASVTGAGGTTSVMNLVADANHFVVIDPGLMAGFFAIPAQMSAWKDKPVIAIVPAFGQSVPLTVSGTAAPATRPSAVPPADAYLALSGPITVGLWYDPASLIVDEVDVPSQNATVIRVSNPPK